MSSSRDAIHYYFSVATYPLKPLIPRGPDGSFDKDCARLPSHIITHNDEHWVYYLATNERWGRVNGMLVWPWPSCGSMASFICKPVAKRERSRPSSSKSRATRSN